jgi:hypothetical protein
MTERIKQTKQPPSIMGIRLFPFSETALTQNERIIDAFKGLPTHLLGGRDRIQKKIAIA